MSLLPTTNLLIDNFLCGASSRNCAVSGLRPSWIIQIAQDMDNSLCDSSAHRILSSYVRR